jgi:predicted Zn-ribbon and HTH transcriptional regulator
MIKYLDTANLIKYTSGNNKGHFNWKENIGKELPFQYDDLTGTIKIIDYKSVNRNNLVTIQYQDNIMTTSTSNLLQLKIPSFLNKNKNNSNYIYKIGDIIDKDFQKSKVIEQTRISVKATKNYETTRGYKLKCLCCGYKYQTREDRISSCPVCGIRSSWTERFIFSIFIQAKIDFEVQKEFEWLQNRWYDIYLPKYNTIIEINGIQHYEPTKNSNREQKSAEQQYLECISSDKLKYDTAIKNGLTYYVIDARDQNN